MIKGSLQNSSFSNKVMQLFAMLVLAIVVITLLTTLLTDSDLNNIMSVKRMQLIQSLVLFVGSPLLLAFLWSEKPLIYLQLKTTNKPSMYVLVAFTMIAAIPFINLLTELNRQISLPETLAPIENWMRATELQLEEITLKMLNVHTISDLIFNLFLIAVLAGLGEELFFRGILQKMFGEWRNAVLAIWLAAFIFSAIHLQFYGFFPRMLLGAFFGYLLFWSGNMWLPILAHTVNNGLAVLFYYLKFNGVQVPDLDTIGTGNTFYLSGISFLVTVFYILKIRKNLVSI
jgi:membrane protease YdiL (CAAX protease family)